LCVADAPATDITGIVAIIGVGLIGGLVLMSGGIGGGVAKAAVALPIVADSGGLAALKTNGLPK
jgi:hypothetical protein